MRCTPVREASEVCDSLTWSVVVTFSAVHPTCEHGDLVDIGEAAVALAIKGGPHVCYQDLSSL